jgi:hypothetical protein
MSRKKEEGHMHSAAHAQCGVRAEVMKKCTFGQCHVTQRAAALRTWRERPPDAKNLWH